MAAVWAFSSGPPRVIRRMPGGHVVDAQDLEGPRGDRVDGHGAQ